MEVAFYRQTMMFVPMQQVLPLVGRLLLQTTSPHAPMLATLVAVVRHKCRMFGTHLFTMEVIFSSRPHLELELALPYSLIPESQFIVHVVEH